MTDERWRRLEEILHEALELRGEARPDFVRAACRGDEAMRLEIESLLVNVGVADSQLGIARLAIGGVRADLIGRQIGVYQIVSLLGAGGMGEVYRARDSKLSREVALKVLPEEFTLDADRLGRFTREAQILASLNHPHIAAIYGLEEADGVRALVLELVEGPTLADRIAGGPIPLAEAEAIARQISEALEAAHEQGIIHRDLKPANIKVREDGTVKVLDFGLAKAFDSGSTVVAMSDSRASTSPAVITGVGVLMGTAAYMSPEQARGKPADRRADMWGFGCVFYEMLTGRRAFDGEGADMLAAVLAREPDWTLLPAGLPPVLGTCLKRCLHKNRKQRLGDAQTMRLALEGALETIAPARAGPSVTRLQMQVRPAERLGGSSDSVSFRPALTSITVSPDGRLVVFAGTRGMVTQLYVRPLDRADATPIPQTEGASEPFFSPDGAWIGFTADNTIKKIPTAGGPPSSICDLPPSLRGVGKSWREDGMIFLSGPAGISRVSSAGGTPVTVTASDASRAERHLLPQCLPGGKAILFTTVISGDWDTANILLHSLESGERRVLIPGGADARYVSTGHLVFMKAGTLMAVPFDALSQRVTGPPVALIESVMQGMNAPLASDETGAGQFAISTSGNLMYVTGGIGPIRQRSLVWVDRLGAPQPPAAPAWLYTGPRISPDGQRIAVYANRGATRRNDVWVYDMLRGAPIRLTVDANSLWPIWSPDGTRIVYASSASGVCNLYAIAADGSGTPERLTTSDCVQLPSSWASTGNVIAFLQRDQIGEDHQIWVLPMDGDRTPWLFLDSRFILAYPDLSPDGLWMAYVSNESGDNEVYVQRCPGPGAKIRISTAGGTEPIWTGNGREILYRAGTPDVQQIFSVAVHSISPFRADVPRMLFEAKAREYGTSAPVRGWDISADGQRFLFVLRSPTSTQEPVTALQVVLNWAEELKRLVPTG